MKKLAVLFPGIGYTADKPLLYHSRRLAEAAGWEVREIRYSGFPKNVRGDREKMAECYRIAKAETRKQLGGGDLGDWDHILFIGKSIGTIVAARLAAKSDFRDRIRLLLYTPMEDTFRFDFGPALVFTGSDDPWVGRGESGIPELCRARGIPCRVIPGGNHSLETGDPLGDLEVLTAVMEETDRFIRAASPEPGHMEQEG